MIKPTKFAHVVYRTRRFDEMLQWYQTVFGATIQYQNRALAFLTYDEEHHRFALADLNAFDPEGSDSEHQSAVGVDHVAYTYASLGDLLETYERLRNRGIKPYWCVRHGPTLSMYFRDPDRNQMEFQVECFASAEEANRYMHSEAFATNPIGVGFDPEELLEQFRAGAPDADLLRRPD